MPSLVDDLNLARRGGEQLNVAEILGQSPLNVRVETEPTIHKRRNVPDTHGFPIDAGKHAAPVEVAAQPRAGSSPEEVAKIETVDHRPSPFGTANHPDLTGLQQRGHD